MDCRLEKSIHKNQGKKFYIWICCVQRTVLSDFFNKNFSFALPEISQPYLFNRYICHFQIENQTLRTFAIVTEIQTIQEISNSDSEEKTSELESMKEKSCIWTKKLFVNSYLTPQFALDILIEQYISDSDILTEVIEKLLKDPEYFWKEKSKKATKDLEPDDYEQKKETEIIERQNYNVDDIEDVE